MKPKFLMRIKQCHSPASNPSTKAEAIVMRKRINVKLRNWMQLWHGLSRVVSGALIKDYEMINKIVSKEERSYWTMLTSNEEKSVVHFMNKKTDVCSLRVRSLKADP